MNISQPIQFVFKDPDWWKKFALVGLITFIPLIGFFVLMGYARRVFDMAQQTDTPVPLPEMQFGSDLSYGVAPFVAALNLGIIGMGLGLVMMVVVFGLAAIDDDLVAFGPLILSPLMLCFGLAAAVIAPEFTRRGFKGEMFPILTPGRSIQAIRADTGTYLWVVVGLFLANFIGGVGVYICFVGALVTMPWGYVAGAVLLAQYDRKLQEKGIL